MERYSSYTVFAGPRQLATGQQTEVVLAAKRYRAADEPAPLLFFGDQTGEQLDFDLRGTEEEVLARLASHPHLAGRSEGPVAPREGPGRPRLGVISREVSLLPRHWEWLGRQPGGASAALRRLVEAARKKAPGEESARLAREALGRVMTALAGDLPGYEEASRALYARDHARLLRLTQTWPGDIFPYVARLAAVVERADRPTT